ncbi:hypothetical protein CALVIDRAFT_559355 [Calocera viscosa TUFC12733]|uniref:Uncharacterized protein n=1 Tax=Calocera viscosa (strain TUFC12733) TaxID=1330018 RepID=A0A167S3B3_CALVF|nr:hypothetical protein CALVIDRAFT_559355 [Calocera viscosa TUFC12733]
MAYILPGRVSHVSSPSPTALATSRHSPASYPTFSLLLPLSELEQGTLDLLGGRMFAYSNQRRAALTGIRRSNLLSASPRGKDAAALIRDKLAAALAAQGLSPDRLGEVYIQCTPSYLTSRTEATAEPLSAAVFYCYEPVAYGQGLGPARRHAAPLWAVLLEVHNNTFSAGGVESGDIYALDVRGHSRDDPAPSGYDHQWSVPASSPSHEPAGAYIVAIKSPPPAPSSTLESGSNIPLPTVRITYALPGSKSSRHTTVLESTSRLPMTTLNLLYCLIKLQLELFFEMPGTIAHTVRTYWDQGTTASRPPLACAESCPSSPASSGQLMDDDSWFSARSPILGWALESPAETYARQRTEAFLRQRVQLEEMTVRLICTSSQTPIFEVAHPKALPHRTLTVHYRSSRFFTLLLATVDSEEAYALGAEQSHEFEATDKAMFTACFAPSYAAYRPTEKEALAHQVRCWTMPMDKRPQWLGHYLDEPAGWSLILVLLWVQLNTLAWKWMYDVLGTTLGSAQDPMVAFASGKNEADLPKPQPQPQLVSVASATATP